MKRNPTVFIGLRMAGDAIGETDEQGNAITDDTLLALLNAHHEGVQFVLPGERSDQQWTVVMDTQNANGGKDMFRRQGDRLRWKHSLWLSSF